MNLWTVLSREADENTVTTVVDWHYAPFGKIVRTRTFNTDNVQTAMAVVYVQNPRPGDYTR